MFGTDMCGNKRFYVRGTKDNCKDFTVDLTWYHSATASIGSIVETADEEVTLNLIVKDSADDSDETWLRNHTKRFNCIGFTSFNEIKGL